MHRRLPWYVPLMFALTGAYLLVEVPFSVHLAGVLGGEATVDDIHRIEHFGRMLSGMAAAIAVLGIWHFPRMERMQATRLRACVTGVVFGGIAATITFLSLGWYADLRAFASDGQERKEAVIAMLAKRAVMASTLPETLDLAPSQRNGFIALMPALLGAESIVSFSGRTAAQLASVAGDDARSALGTVAQAKSEFFASRFAAARNAYDSYASSLSDAKAAHANMDDEAESAWRKYSAEMDRSFPRGWPTRDGWSHAAAWRKVRFTHGIPVPEGWNLHNKAVFIAAVKTKISNSIAERYQQAVDLQLGKGTHLKPGLSYEQFLSVPAVQKLIRDNMNDAGIPRDLVISPAMSDKAFEAVFYLPQIDKAVDAMREAVAARPTDYERGTLARDGEDAVKATILPALALMMSLIGTVVHIYKFAGYGLQMASHFLRIRPLQRGLMRHAAVASVLGLVAFQTLDITPSALASPAIGQIATAGVYPSVLTAVVMAQPHLEAIGGSLSQIGVWEVVSSDLPQPRPIQAASTISQTQVASLSIPVPQSRPVD
ncbi:hypothetical protein G6L37_02875 [Agrobacterium rubi]|nr:hypothetical protein [Agrobacterium rubi]NTF24321.1 hypothetical protein [Agrobacterium rubi]